MQFISFKMRNTLSIYSPLISPNKGYIDEIASMKEDEEETENKLKGTQSTHFPTLKEAKKMAKMARKSKATLKDVMDWN